MMKMTKRRIRRLLTVPCLLLALCLTLSVTALAVNEVDDQGEVPKAALTVKPVVTIQGNVVVDNGKPTGYYELALCVRSARTITLTADGSAVSEEAYANDIAADPNHATDGTYTVIYHPFSAAAATVGVNADALTAVNWDVTEVTYAAWDAAAGQYADDDTGYPRGIDVIANTDPEVWLGTDPDPFPDVTQARQNGVYSKAVALDAEGDRSAFTATGQVDDYYENIATGTKTALVTLSAHAPDNKPVVFTTDTPVAVVRFSYDLKRFNKTAVSENQDVNYDITGEEGTDGGFWLGFDRGSDPQVGNGNKTPLTWLADTAQGGSFAFSDQKAASTEMGQVVWTKIGVATVDEDGVATGGWDETDYYYYLGAEGYNKYPDTETIQVNINGVPTAVEDVAIPATVGAKVLTPGSAQNPGATPAEYTYFVNLLRLADRTLRLKMVNEPTFRRPTGISGPQILFYDWDDTLIGSLMVTKGDVRAQVNAYLEKTLVHPDLRSDSPFMVDESGSGGMSQEEKYASLTRDYTYRGKYAYTVGGNDADLGVENGKEYPLTNKLDYVFTKRVNTAITQTENGSQVQYVHPYTLDDPELDAAQEDGALYPWVYGWAVVEDTRAFNGNKAATGDLGEWKVMHDAAKLEDTWTTMGVGELAGMKYAAMTNSTLSTVAAVDPAAVRSAPVFLADDDPAWADGTKGDDYLYTLSGENRYLRFADFSDITAEMDRYNNKDTLVVKAVYEEGPELFVGGRYQMVKEPYYNKYSDMASYEGGAYSVEVTLERATTQRGPIQGVNRVRMPAVRQDTTTDQKWIQDNALGVDHNLSNADIKAAKALTETTFTKVDIDNGEEITFQLSLSARQNKADYFIIETYGYNFVAGAQRSLTNFERNGIEHAVDNYNYYTGDSDTNDGYYDVSKYDERDGSHGYVLYGTLNYLMERATLAQRGDITQNAFSLGSTVGVLQDANLRTDTSGTQPDAASAILVMQPQILAAATECIANPTADTWNFERDYAELSYHQLQYYLLGDPVWSNRTAADAKPIAWCHLHASCAAAVSGKPKDWDELVAYAKDSTKADGIGELLPGEIETLFGLRKTNGAQYTSGAEFKANVVAAVNAGCESWAEIQYHILYKTAPADAAAALAEAKTSFWWYDKSTSAPGTPGNLRALVTATDDYFKVFTLPDGTQEDGWTAKLDRGKKNFDSNNDGDNTTVATGWKNMTQNLVAKWVIEEVGGKPTGAESTEKFADWESFRSELLRVVEIARTAGVTPASDSEYWYKAQYLILHPDETTWPTFGVGDGTAEGDEMDGYWWHNGGTHLFINNLQSMLNVAGLVNDGDEAAKGVWDRFRLADFQKCEDMTDFVLNFTGTNKIDNLEADGLTPNSNEMNDFKGKILALKEFGANNTWFDLDASNNANLWKDVQFWLLHEAVEVKPGVPSTEYQYYWWEDNGAPVPLTPVGLRGNVRGWLNMAFAEVYNGNTVAWDEVTANNADGLSNNAFNNTRLRNPAAEDVTPGNTTYQNVNDIPVMSVADVKIKMNALIVEVMTGKTGHSAHTPPTKATWYQVQHYIITGEYIETPTAEQTAAWEKQYWWLDLDENPDKAQVVVDTAAIDTFIEKFIYPDNKISTIELDDLERNDGGELTFRRTDAATGFSGRGMLNKAKDRLNGLLTANSAAQTPPQSLDTLTWYQIQYALMDASAGGGEGAYLTPNQAYNWGKDLCTWAPDWVKQLPEPPAPEPLNYFVKTFLSSSSATSTVVLADLDGSALGQLNFKKADATTGFAGRGVINTAKTRLASLLTNLPGGVSADSLTWYQIQYALMDEGDGAYKSPLEAYQWAQALPVTWAPPCATTAAVPEGASLLALYMEELPEMETPLVADMQAPAPEVTETVTPETAADLRDRIEAMERELEALKERLEALEAASAPVEAPEETPAPAKPAPTPVKPVTPVKPEPAPTEPETPEQVELAPVEQEPAPETPETPAETEPVSQEPTPAPNYNERAETPLGEEAVWRGVRIVNTARQRDGSSVVPTARTVPAVLLDVGVLPPRPKYILVRRA